MGTREVADRCVYPEDADLEAWRTEHRPHRRWVDEAPAPWPVRVATPRLRLRPWRPHEARALWGLVRENAAALQPWMPWAWEVAGVEAYVKLVTEWERAALDRRELVFGIFLPDGRPVGGIGLHARCGPGGLEVGYWLAEGARGQGYATEATAAMVQVALRGIGVDRVELHCHPENVRSAAVARRLGFVHEATLPRRAPDGRGGRHDVLLHAVYADGLAASPAAAVPVRAWDVLGRDFGWSAPPR
jgi:RimJ/RimL family protein N-acetyltransferase